jgi:hypothetical protein
MIQDFYKKEGIRSLELAFNEKVQEGAAAQLLASIKVNTNVALKLGSIVLIKVNANREEITFIFNLTDKQRQYLEKNSFFLNQPQNQLKYLNEKYGNNSKKYRNIRIIRIIKSILPWTIDRTSH